MDKRTRNQIERHFYRHSAKLQRLSPVEAEIIEAGLTADPGRTPGGGGHGDPTASKALKLAALNLPQTVALDEWGCVVQSVFDAYHALRPDIYAVMVAKYIDCLSAERLAESFAHANTIKRWRQSWLEIAHNLANEKGLIKKLKKK